MVRCPRCGNDNRPEAFVCDFCSAKLKFERIEKIKYFERPEERWKRPGGVIKRFKQVFTSPSWLFWDLRYDDKRKGSGYILLFNSLLMGLLGLILAGKVIAVEMPATTVFLTHLTTFLMFFMLGLIYYSIFFLFLSYLYGKVAIRESGDKEKHSYKAMLYAFFPSVIGNAVTLLILLIALPTVSFEQMGINLSPIFSNSAWLVADIITLVIFVAWIPILSAICIRTLHEISTTRSLAWSIVIGVVSSIILIFSRGTFFPSAAP